VTSSRPLPIARLDTDAFGSARSTQSIRVRWLGTASIELESQGYRLLIDPYATRASLWRCAAVPLVPDPIAIARYFPNPDAIIATHTHVDHVLDIPTIARETGAKVIGSPSLIALCRSAGLGETVLHAVSGAETIELGPFQVSFVPSVHSRMFFGRVIFPGEI